MMMFSIRLVLGASAFIGHTAATDEVSAEYLNSIPVVMNPYGVACQDEFHITSARLCVMAAKRIKIKRMKINITPKQSPYGCSLRGKTVYFSLDKNKKPPKKWVTPICRILPVCCTCDPDFPSSVPTLMPTVTVEPSVDSSKIPSLMPSFTVEPTSTIDPSSTFSFNENHLIKRASDENDYNGIVAKPPTDYVMSFKITPWSRLPLSDFWGNIMHITTGERCCAYGTRVPAVYFYKKTKRIAVITGYNLDGNPGLYPGYLSSKELTIQTEYDVEIRVVGNNFTLSIDGIVDITKYIGDRSPLLDVKVYIGNPWERAADASIRNVYFGPA